MKYMSWVGIIELWAVVDFLFQNLWFLEHWLGYRSNISTSVHFVTAAIHLIFGCMMSDGQIQCWYLLLLSLLFAGQ